MPTPATIAPAIPAHRPCKGPARRPKMPPVETGDELSDLRVIVAWSGIRPLHPRRRHQYRLLARYGII